MTSEEYIESLRDDREIYLYGERVKDVTSIVLKRQFALVAAIAMDAPGVTLICQPSYSAMSAGIGSPFDYPLSSRMDENDTILVLDKVLIPGKNVFIYGSLKGTAVQRAVGLFRALYLPRVHPPGAISSGRSRMPPPGSR